jgi:hypothetical protein
MLAFLKAKPNTRKPLLLAAACYNRLRDHLPSDSPLSYGGIWNRYPADYPQQAWLWGEVARRVAEGQGDEEELYLVGKAEAFESWKIGAYLLAPPGVKGALHAVWDLIWGAWDGPGASEAWNEDAAVGQAWAAERKVQADLVREIFGNPFRSVPWIRPGSPGNVVRYFQFAGDIYEAGSFKDMPLLADALEEAGCADEAILTHCRSAGEHVRGCWVLDLILGKQ